MVEILSLKPCCANCADGVLDVNAFAKMESVDMVASFIAAGVRSEEASIDVDAMVDGKGVSAESIVAGMSEVGIGGGVAAGIGGGGEEGG